MIHTYAWITWLLATLVSLSTTRNPFYLILTLFCIMLVYYSLGHTGEFAPVPVSPVRFIIVVIILTALFNTFTSHFGESVLFIIPGELPLLSGPITLEALIYGATNGLVLSGFFAAFLVLNRAVPVRALLRLVPRAFYPVAVVISVAVTYIPSTQHQLTQIREAQAIRGHRVQGARGWLPLLIPLLVGGMERALSLAEAMSARGFASSSLQAGGTSQRILLLIGMLLLPTGWIMSLVNGISTMVSAFIMLIGAGFLAFGMWSAGRHAPHTIYHQETWKTEDWIVILGGMLTLGAYILPITQAAGSDYSPYPQLTLPPFNPLLGVMTLGLLVPVLINRGK